MKNSAIYKARREKFMAEMQGGIAVLLAAPHANRNADNNYEYRTCSYFYYLTGLHEEKAALILVPDSDKPFRLFVQPKDPERELWDGKLYGVDEAKKVFGADECRPIVEFEDAFREVLRRAGNLYYGVGLHPRHDDRILRIVSDFRPNPRAGEKPVSILRPQDSLARMRMVKDDLDLEWMRKSAANTSEAHKRAMMATKPGMHEYDVEAEIEYWFRRGGAEDLAYPSIVAGGNNATVLHYNTNREPLKNGDLLLIDAGGEMGMYASDITRTFPVGGKFTPAQRKLYDLVLKANKVAIAMVKPGVRFHEVHAKAVEVLVDGLLELGLLKGKREEIVKDRKNYAAFYPHNTSHWLGLDVHDAGIYFDESGESMPLAEGYVLTIEPGIYIAADRADVPPEYRGIGIRIEDDVLVTAHGSEVLTSACPKEAAELEALVGTGSR